MRKNLPPILELIVLIAAGLNAQPTNGAVYWSKTSPDCSSLYAFGSPETAEPILNQRGATVGYSCYVSGTFPWLAAGGQWSTAIRVAAPASAPIGVDYELFDTNGNPLTMDTAGFYATSSSDVNFALYANQPSEIDLLGATGTGPGHSVTATGSVYVTIYCPDATTCGNVLPQLIYSALPSQPWSLSGTLVWDATGIYLSSLASTQFSAEGIDDGVTHRVSLVIYNDDVAATTYTISVFNSAGTLVGQGTTPSVPSGATTVLGQGGTYGALLSSIIPTPLPSGVFKVLIDGGTLLSEVEMIQFNGTSATTMQVAYDTSYTATPAAGNSSAAAIQRPNLGRPRGAPRNWPVFRTMTNHRSTN